MMTDDLEAALADKVGVQLSPWNVNKNTKQATGFYVFDYDNFGFEYVCSSMRSKTGQKLLTIQSNPIHIHTCTTYKKPEQAEPVEKIQGQGLTLTF